MRVAFTSTDGKVIDRHFGQTEQFVVWEVGPDSACCVGELAAAASNDEEDRISAKAAVLEGCAIVYTMQIGGPAAAKLLARRINPLKTGTELPISEAVTRLQGVLRGSPPPWMRKIMGLPGRELAVQEEE